MLKKNMLIEDRLKKISTLLEEYLPFVSQWDMDVIQGRRFNHKWISEVMLMSHDTQSSFDANRNFLFLNDLTWKNLIQEMQSLCSFDNYTPLKDFKLQTYGNLKKQHELKHLYQYAKKSGFLNREILDFGGGVGNLAFFLEKQFQMQVHVIEQDQNLIKKGQVRKLKEKSNINFIQNEINKESYLNENLTPPFAIGLHTCGNFASDMLTICAHKKINKIINFGCCYSKIKDNNYNLSQASNKNLFLNQRALAAGTLGFGKASLEIYNYRLKIMDYKFSYYNWMFQEYAHKDFISMSNSRRSLYNLNFTDFTYNCLDKFHPNIKKPEKGILEKFHTGKKNEELISYFKAYYAISRYFGPLVEAYILCDRALFMQEKGYKVEIKEFFDSQISPRNKAIIAQIAN